MEPPIPGYLPVKYDEEVMCPAQGHNLPHASGSQTLEV